METQDSSQQVLLGRRLPRWDDHKNIKTTNQETGFMTDKRKSKSENVVIRLRLSWLFLCLVFHRIWSLIALPAWVLARARPAAVLPLVLDPVDLHLFTITPTFLRLPDFPSTRIYWPQRPLVDWHLALWLQPLKRMHRHNWPQ